MGGRLYGMLLAASLGATSATASADVLSLALAPDLRCPEPDALQKALAAQLSQLDIATTASASDRFSLALRAHGPQGVELELREHDEVLVARTLEVGADECSDLAQTLALITAAWIQAPRPPPPPVAASIEVATEASAPPPEVQQPITPESVARDPESPFKTKPSAPAPPAAYRLSLEAGAGTTLPLESDPAPVIAGRIGAELTWAGWLLALRANFETARTLDARAAVSVQHNSLELALGVSVVRAARFDLALSLATGVELISAQVVSYAKTDIDPALSGVSAFAVRGAFRASRALDLFGSLELAVSWRRAVFESLGDPVAETPRARPRLIMGASWHVL